MESPRRYPRSLEQAFGPYTSRHIHVEAPRSSLRAWAVYLAVVAIALACAVLAGCTEAKAGNGSSFQRWGLGTVDRTEVDENGVVCYSRGGHSLSCVKVK